MSNPKFSYDIELDDERTIRGGIIHSHIKSPPAPPWLAAHV